MAKKNQDDPFGGLDTLADELFGKKPSTKKQESVKQQTKTAAPSKSTGKTVDSSSEVSHTFAGLDSLADELFGKKSAPQPEKKEDKAKSDPFDFGDTAGFFSSDTGKKEKTTRGTASGKTTKSVGKEAAQKKASAKSGAADSTDYGEFDIPDPLPRAEVKAAGVKKTAEKAETVAVKAKPATKTTVRGEDIATLAVSVGKSRDKDFALDLSGKDSLLLIDGKNYEKLTDSVILSACLKYSPVNLEVVCYDFESRSSSCFADYVKGYKKCVPQIEKIKFVDSEGLAVLDCLDEIENEQSDRKKFFEMKGFKNFAEYIADCKRKSEVPELKRVIYVFSNANKPFGNDFDTLGVLVRSKFEVLISDAKEYGITVVATCFSASLFNEEVAEAFASKITFDGENGTYRNDFCQTNIIFEDISDESIISEAKAVRSKFGDFPDEQIVEDI